MLSTGSHRGIRRVVLDDMAEKRSMEKKMAAEDMKTVPRYNQHFVQYLEQQVRYYLSILESMFGPRDPRFEFGSIRKSSDDIPRTYFPNSYYKSGGCVVDICLSDWPWERHSYDQGTWQVAHECVHLLDPGVGGTTNLEEGLASWFQNEPRFHSDDVKRYIARNNKHGVSYESARGLVLRCMPQLIPAVKEIRLSGTGIPGITTNALAAKLDVDSDIIEKLCARFT